MCLLRSQHVDGAPEGDLAAGAAQLAYELHVVGGRFHPGSASRPAVAQPPASPSPSRPLCGTPAHASSLARNLRRFPVPRACAARPLTAHTGGAWGNPGHARTQARHSRPPRAPAPRRYRPIDPDAGGSKLSNSRPVTFDTLLRASYFGKFSVSTARTACKSSVNTACTAVALTLFSSIFNSSAVHDLNLCSVINTDVHHQYAKLTCDDLMMQKGRDDAAEIFSTFDGSEGSRDRNYVRHR